MPCSTTLHPKSPITTCVCSLTSAQWLERLPGTYEKIDEITKNSVIFISSPPNLPNAVYGGLMSNRAKASGAVGTVVDGRIRDLNEHREIGMPVSPVQQT
jgi:regulator of RNase E activity RraA